MLRECMMAESESLIAFLRWEADQQGEQTPLESVFEGALVDVS